MSEIAERLKKLRGSEAQGVFAARLGLKQAVYCHYEKGRREPSLDALVNIALRLGCSTDWLLGVPGASDPSALSEPPRETKTVVTAGDGSPVVNGVTAGRDVIVNAPNQAPARPARRRRKAPAKSDQKKMAPSAARDPGAPG